MNPKGMELNFLGLIIVLIATLIGIGFFDLMLKTHYTLDTFPCRVVFFSFGS